MAADVALLRPSCPGGASPGPRAILGNVRAGLVTEAVGAVGKGLPSTAVRRRSSARLGLNLARRKGEPARRRTRALAARATATDAVRPPIPFLTSRRHLDRTSRPRIPKRVWRGQIRHACRHPPGLERHPTIAAENRLRRRVRAMVAPARPRAAK